MIGQMPKIKGYRVTKDGGKSAMWIITCKRCESHIVLESPLTAPSMAAIDWALEHNLTHSKRKEAA